VRAEELCEHEEGRKSSKKPMALGKRLWRRNIPGISGLFLAKSGLKTG
jgi:hypothetical protein